MQSQTEPVGPDAEEDRPVNSGPHLRRADDRDERPAGAHQRRRAFQNLAADHVEHHIDLAFARDPSNNQSPQNNPVTFTMPWEQTATLAQDATALIGADEGAAGTVPKLATLRRRRQDDGDPGQRCAARAGV